MLRSLTATLLQRPRMQRSLARLEQRLEAGFPKSMKPVIEFLVTGKADAEVLAVRDQVERIRQEIAAGGDACVDILYSPKPGSSGTEVVPGLRPAHGETIAFTMARVAKTGKDKRWGTALHLLARACRAESILELGSCAGISGCYLASTPDCTQFTTVEGSEALAQLAQQSLHKICAHGKVVHGLFDDAMDTLLTAQPRYDLVFIDGHHEKIGTIHYFKRLAPYLSDHAMVIFDDISWSSDMRDGWNELCTESRFAHTIDLGLIGVCLWGQGDRPTQHWNMQDVVGEVAIGKPHGWKAA